jgi:hypothetical protein
MFAEVNVSALQYQYIKELGEIVISNGDIAAIQNDNSEAAIPELNKKDIFLLWCKGQPQTFKRHQKIGEHLIDTEISLSPAPGHGFAGARSTAYLVLTVDGKKRVDCDLQAGNISVRTVALSVNDDFLSVDGEYMYKPFQIHQSRLDKHEIIETRSLMAAVKF